MTTSTSLLSVRLLLVIIVCSRHAVRGAVWSWMLTNPAAAAATMDSDSLRQHSARSISHQQPHQQHDGGATEIKRFQPHRHQHQHHGQQETNIRCADDRNCDRGLFCDRHYGTCAPHRREGEHCRRDNHCGSDGGHECVFGRCRKYVKKGDKGSRCRNDAECGGNGVPMCCARHHGEYVCKLRLPIGHRCFVPDGGLDYTLNEMCPCQEGLTCRKSSPGKTKSKDEEFSWKPWSDNEIFRCTLP